MRRFKTVHPRCGLRHAGNLRSFTLLMFIAVLASICALQAHGQTRSVDRSAAPAYGFSGAGYPRDLQSPPATQRTGSRPAANSTTPSYQRSPGEPRLLPEFEDTAQNVRVTGHGVGRPNSDTDYGDSARADYQEVDLESPAPNARQQTSRPARSHRSINRATSYDHMRVAANNDVILQEDMLHEDALHQGSGPEVLPAPIPIVRGSIGPNHARGDVHYGGRRNDHCYGGCRPDACDRGRCGHGNCGGCNNCGPCSDWYFAKDLSVFGGVHGFKNSVDESQNGNFGFQEGINWSSPFWNEYGIGFQLGGAAVQSDFNDSVRFQDERSQFFLTTGFFQRQMSGCGWQWGVVYDHLFDEFEEDFDVSQVRGELSYLFRGHEFGFLFASNVGDYQPDTAGTSGIIAYETVDQYAFFYRRRLLGGGEGRLWGGFTGDSDGIFGGDFRLPIACDWDLTGNFNYISPQEDSTIESSESWNIGINLAWYICRDGALKAGCSPYRPLFSVADNGTLVTRTRR